ncbi:MAG: carbohydrate kinase [Acidobacteria bacterium]|nr:MAG: carbohydrate kinase [Acidobacteriota bacterium]
MKKDHFIVVGLGELLWDIFPSGKQLGGAPANFAYVTSVLGDRGLVASRVGRDELGNETQDKLQALGLECTNVQKDSDHPTGTVQVCVDSAGQPRFQITESTAWDFLQWTEEYRQLAFETDAVCFGSLAQRSPQSRETIRQFLAATPANAARVFDVNLRQSFFSADIVRQSMHIANMVKLNHEELPRVMGLVGLASTDMHSAMHGIMRHFDLQLICVTRGENGSVLRTAEAVDEHPGLQVPVKDTVGAGDAFTAGLLHCFLRGTSLKTMNAVANQMGAWVAGHQGATPPRASAPLTNLVTDRAS